INRDNKGAAYSAIGPPPKNRYQRKKRNQRQPLKQFRRVESPSGIDRHQVGGDEEFSQVPPNGHTRVGKPAGERSNNDFLLADAAILKPNRDQAEHSRQQKERPSSSYFTAEARARCIPGAPPCAEQQRNRQKHHLRL